MNLTESKNNFKRVINLYEFILEINNTFLLSIVKITDQCSVVCLFVCF